ncbi:MAG: cation-translocating P-type ATPase [Gammaproteobacteria bacterium]
MKLKPWHTLTIDDTRKALATMPSSFTPNQLEDVGKVRWYYILIHQFNKSLIFILLVATIFSVFLGDIVDALAILAIVIFNGILGFIQEWKAETAIKNLKKMLSPRCRIFRNGKEQEIDAVKLIPGDCVILRTGNAVPADIRLTETIDLMTDEAALTGESTPIVKMTDPLPEETLLNDRSNMAFMGTHIVNGHGKGLVVETGMNTEFGLIAELTSEITETKTPLQKQLATIAKQFGLLALCISIAVSIVGILSGKSIITMLMTGISLAVSAVPEGLPAVVTITLALGTVAMAHKKALLRRLEAAETLGAVSVICTDKTGTLTKNEMTVQKIWTPEEEIYITGVGYDPTGFFQKNGHTIDPQSHPALMSCLETSRKCNHAHIKKDEDGWKAIGSPDEAALIVAAVKSGLIQDNKIDIITEFSFNSARKRMSVIEKTSHHQVVHAKGAPEVMLERCTHFIVVGKKEEITDEVRRQIKNVYINFAEEGLRTLVLAKKELLGEIKITEEQAENQLTFLGIVGIFDPPRTEVSDALIKAKKAGIKVIMITGDSPVTAKAIANQIGFSIEKTVTSSDMEKMNDETLSELLKQEILFARTIPKDKLRIVQLLQKNDQLVAMTGDGVNDAPALKQADVGIAMGIRGTDVAKSTADIVLSDDNFASIVSAVQEGRRQYANIRKFVLYLTSSNIGEVIAILINILVGGPLILLPIQILWINLVTDSATSISLSVEREEKNSMDEPPRQMNMPILNKMSFLLLSLFGSYIGVVAFILYSFYLNQSYQLANTVAFTAVVIMANIHVLNFRNLHAPITQIGWLSNKWLLIAILSMLALQITAIYTPWLQHVLYTVPLTMKEWATILLSSLPLFIIPEIYKWLRYKSY